MTLLEPSPHLFPTLIRRLPAIDGNGIVQTRAETLRQAFSGADAPRQPDTVIYVNVLEHIEDDDDELRTVHSILPSGGCALIFVPANRWLMGTMDHQLGHFRRYTRDDLSAKCRSLGFRIRLAEYFDVIGIVPWWLKYCLLKSHRLEASAVEFYDRLVVPISRTLERFVTPPIGKSVILVAEKP
jgi:hypothetical protein